MAVPTSVAPTDVIPGSEVQETTALRQTSLPKAPDMGASTIDRLIAAFTVGAAGMAAAGRGRQDNETMGAMRGLFEEL